MAIELNKKSFQKHYNTLSQIRMSFSLTIDNFGLYIIFHAILKLYYLVHLELWEDWLHLWTICKQVACRICCCRAYSVLRSPSTNRWALRVFPWRTSCSASIPLVYLELKTWPSLRVQNLSCILAPTFGKRYALLCLQCIVLQCTTLPCVVLVYNVYNVK